MKIPFSRPSNPPRRTNKLEISFRTGISRTTFHLPYLLLLLQLDIWSQRESMSHSEVRILLLLPVHRKLQFQSRIRTSDDSLLEARIGNSLYTPLFKRHNACTSITCQLLPLLVNAPTMIIDTMRNYGYNSTNQGSLWDGNRIFPFPSKISSSL